MYIYSMRNVKYTIVCLSAIIAVVVIIIIHRIGAKGPVSPPDIPITRYTQKEAHQAFLKLKAEYESTLASRPKPIYRDAAQFTETGPPIGSVMKSNQKANLNRRKTVLLWTEFFGKVNWMGERWCKEEEFKCDISTDKNDLLKSDAVVFHPRDIKTLPTERPPNQRWLYFIQEAPYATGIDFATYNGVFNWTMTFRRDSDFPIPYYNSTVLEKPLTDEEYRKIISSIMAKKQRLVAIMHANCNPQSNRMEVVRELRRYVPVDFYGACGELNCSRHADICPKLLSTYKFYLSFENSKCREYITEKVGYPLHQWNSVPIVLGPPEADYARVLPPGSYIHVDGFSSVKKLAEFITLLDENPALYEIYHTWRQTHTKAESETYCNFCKALFDESLPLKSYRDFLGWYDQDICFPSWFERYGLKFIMISSLLILIFLLTQMRKRMCNHKKS